MLLLGFLLKMYLGKKRIQYAGYKEIQHIRIAKKSSKTINKGYICLLATVIEVGTFSESTVA